MKDIIAEIVSIVIVFVCFVGFLAVIIHFHSATETKKWNNGYCECGGKWEYEQAVGHRSGTSYIYICDKCGKREEFDVIR